jgi:multidrug efflux pump subunit AcrB
LTEDVETAVTNPIEDVVARVAHVSRLRSRSSDERATFRIDFEPGTEIDTALGDVQHAIADVQRQLPSGVEPPIVTKAGGTIVGRYLLTSYTATEVELANALHKLADKILTVDGVGRIDYCGGKHARIDINIAGDALAAHGLDVATIAKAVRNVRGGIAELDAMTLGAIRLTDVANIRDAPVSNPCHAYFRGRESAEALVFAQRGADVDRVRDQVDEIAKGPLPADLKLEVVPDRHVITVGVCPLHRDARLTDPYSLVREVRGTTCTLVLAHEDNALGALREQLGREGIVEVGEPDATLELRGPELGKLLVGAQVVSERIHPVARVGFEPPDKPHFAIDRATAADLGIDLESIATTLEALDGPTIRVSVYGNVSLDNITIKAGNGELLPLSRVVTKAPPARGEILHDNRQRMVGFRVRANEVPPIEPMLGIDIRVVPD